MTKDLRSLACPVCKSIPGDCAVPRCGFQRAILPLVSQRLPAGALVVILMSLVQFLGPADFILHPAAAIADTSRDKAKANAAHLKSAITRVALDDLPIPVQEMRDAILIATTSGDIEDLRTAIEWNELPPEFGFDGGLDPIEQFRKLSKDGSGREFLAILANLLSQAPAQLPIGPDHENNGVLVWPYISELDPQKLSPAQQVELYRLMPVAEAQEVMKHPKWTWYRLAIAADGTWHIFSK